MVQIENLPIVLTGLGLTASVLYYTMVLRNANKTRELQLRAQEQAEDTRQTQFFMNVYNRFQDPEFTQFLFSLGYTLSTKKAGRTLPDNSVEV